MSDGRTTAGFERYAHGQTMRSPIFGRKGMVATAHPLATHVAVQILEEGGNAVDAAIAAAGVLAVALPPMNGLGGDAFLLHYDASTGRTTTLNGSGRVGDRATLPFLAARGHERQMPRHGILAAAVPGAVGTYLTALRRWGSMPLSALWAPATRLGREGVPIVRTVAARIGRSGTLLASSRELSEMYLPNSSPLRQGSILRQPDLARTIGALADAGASDGIELFYRGDIGRRIGEHVEHEGGLFTYQDMVAHETEVLEPLSITYRDCRVHETAPPSQGAIVLEMLGLLEGFPLHQVVPSSADQVHLLTEAKKIAFADRNRYLADPTMTDFRVEQLLDTAFLANRREGINVHEAVEPQPNPSPMGSHDTTYLAVADGFGNCVSLITSLSNSFGSGITVPGTGIVLNNRAGRGFSLDPAHPNVLAPRKRTMHTLNCYIVEREGRPILVGGTPGGDAQPQINTQVLVNLLDAGLDVQQAADAPRWQHLPGTDPSTLGDSPKLMLEASFRPAVDEELRARGHTVERVSWLGGGVQLVAIDWENMTFAGGSDSRADGCALSPG